MYKKNCLPENTWKELQTPLEVRGFNDTKDMIKYNAENITYKSGRKSCN